MDSCSIDHTARKPSQVGRPPTEHLEWPSGRHVGHLERPGRHRQTECRHGGEPGGQCPSARSGVPSDDDAGTPGSAPSVTADLL